MSMFTQPTKTPWMIVTPSLDCKVGGAIPGNPPLPDRETIQPSFPGNAQIALHARHACRPSLIVLMATKDL
jgi:hypothetical protein